MPRGLATDRMPTLRPASAGFGGQNIKTASPLCPMKPPSIRLRWLQKAGEATPLLLFVSVFTNAVLLCQAACNLLEEG